MNEIDDPTPEQIQEFCANLATSMMRARLNGDVVTIRQKNHNQPLYDANDRREAIQDAVFTGWEVIVQCGEPAEKTRAARR